MGTARPLCPNFSIAVLRSVFTRIVDGSFTLRCTNSRAERETVDYNLFQNACFSEHFFHIGTVRKLNIDRAVTAILVGTNRILILRHPTRIYGILIGGTSLTIFLRTIFNIPAGNGRKHHAYPGQI